MCGLAQSQATARTIAHAGRRIVLPTLVPGIGRIRGTKAYRAGIEADPGDAEGTAAAEKASRAAVEVDPGFIDARRNLSSVN